MPFEMSVKYKLKSETGEIRPTLRIQQIPSHINPIQRNYGTPTIFKLIYQVRKCTCITQRTEKLGTAHKKMEAL